jgi:uncharacterized membrane protein YphA (DoxX/SURF4 family)
MTPANPESGRRSAAGVVCLIARWLLAGVFLYMGLNKALHPVEFLKLVRQYDFLTQPLALNLVAAALPWFEIFCGMLLAAGVAVRGTAVMLLVMLIPFTVLVFLRAQAMQHSGGLPFCAIKFDCGCGAGEVLICRKLAENALLLLLSALLIFRQQHRLGLRPNLL